MPHAMKHLAAVWVAASALLFAGGGQDAPAAPSFDQFLDGVRAEARSRGVSEATIDAALSDLTPEPVVVARDRAQPELTQSLEAYVAGRLTPRVLANAREAAKANRALLARVAAAYGVPPPVLVAVWGMESNFGRFTGAYPTIRALATLAFDGRRPLFRSELFDALRILDRGDARPEDLKGSWAGAMGQPQFMPSSYLAHAVDFDGDGRPDIWTSTADVLASMANFLKDAGWTAGERWGREVTLSKRVLAEVERQVPMRTSGCRALRELTIPRPVSEWRTLGVTTAGGGALPSSEMPASLVRGRSRAFLVYRNYEALLEYNCSNAYAVAVALLAERI